MYASIVSVSYVYELLTDTNGAGSPELLIDALLNSLSGSRVTVVLIDSKDKRLQLSPLVRKLRAQAIDVGFIFEEFESIRIDEVRDFLLRRGVKHVQGFVDTVLDTWNVSFRFTHRRREQMSSLIVNSSNYFFVPKKSDRYGLAVQSVFNEDTNVVVIVDMYLLCNSLPDLVGFLTKVLTTVKTRHHDETIEMLLIVSRLKTEERARKERARRSVDAIAMEVSRRVRRNVGPRVRICFSFQSSRHARAAFLPYGLIISDYGWNVSPVKSQGDCNIVKFGSFSLPFRSAYARQLKPYIQNYRMGVDLLGDALEWI